MNRFSRSRTHRARLALTRTFCLPALLCLLGAALPVYADEDDGGEDEVSAAVEETFLGELVFPQEAGELQISLGAAFGDEEDTADAVFEWGLTDAWQIEVELAGVLDGDETGLSTVELGVRYSKMDLGPHLHLGVGASLTMATRDLEESAEGSIFFEPALILAGSWDDGRTHLFTGLSTEWLIDDGDLVPGEEEPEDEIEWVLGGYRAGPWGTGTLELQAERDVEGEEDTEWTAAFGWIFPLGSGELGIARAVQLEGDDDDLWLIRWTLELDLD